MQVGSNLRPFPVSEAPIQKLPPKPSPECWDAPWGPKESRKEQRSHFRNHEIGHELGLGLQQVLGHSGVVKRAASGPGLSGPILSAGHFPSVPPLPFKGRVCMEIELTQGKHVRE